MQFVRFMNKLSWRTKENRGEYQGFVTKESQTGS